MRGVPEAGGSPTSSDMSHLLGAIGTNRRSNSTQNGTNQNTPTNLGGVDYPARHPGTTFPALPRIRSERPAFEPHYPHVIERSALERAAHPMA